MQTALEETERRRKKQIEYNLQHGITPQTIKKKVSGVMQEMTAKDEKQASPSETLATKDIDKKLREYNKLMQQAAADLDFETAIAYRDKIKKLEETYLKN